METEKNVGRWLRHDEKVTVHFLLVMSVLTPAGFMVFYKIRSKKSKADSVGFIAALVVLFIAIYIFIYALRGIGLDA